MICIIRIRGKVKLDRDVKETFDRMRLGRKYSCIVIHPNKEQKGMIKKLRNLVSFGEINRETFEKLLERRGQKTDKEARAEEDGRRTGKGEKIPGPWP